ncbi:MAG: transcription elongation factor GreA [Myxococcales bacterium]|jgi:transcription elongation factor GreA|nr:transcription elongation factor GreA [Myxococcales bacterium]
MELPVVIRLKKELQELRYDLTVKVPKELQEAAAHGDLSENAEYDAAKARQEFLKARIGQIENRIRELSMYTLASIPHGVVAYGSRVTVVDDEEGTTLEYRIVFPEEVDAASGAISLSSPIGRALLNREVGDEVEVLAPGGKRSYQIVGLVTFHQAMGHTSGEY